MQMQMMLAESPTDVFKRIYYRLYSNSEASRAETIMANLSLLLLVYFEMRRTQDGAKALAEFTAGILEADELLGLARAQDPDLIDDDERFTISGGILRDVFSDLAALGGEDEAHMMGDAFQALMGPRLRGDKGQFFTPRSLVRTIVDIADPGPGTRVVDPACGTGSFLLEAVAHAARKGTSAPKVIGCDKDRDLGRLAQALLRIVEREGDSEIHVGNSLDLDQWEEGSYDFVLTNPPFGAKIGIDDPKILSKYDFGYKAASGQVPQRGVGAMVASQDPQLLFTELCVRLLKPGGLMAIVLPEGVFGNRQTAFVWEWLRKRGAIEALIDCPRTTFQPGTDTKTNVLVFRGATAQPKSIHVAVAKQCGHDRRGRTITASGAPVPDDFSRIGPAYMRKKSPLWTKVPALDSDYMVPRYLAMRSRLNDLDFGIAADSPRRSLGDLVEAKLLRITKGHEVGSEAYGTGDIPFVRTSDISNFEIRIDPTNGVSEELYEKFARQQSLTVGDVLLVVDGRYRIGAAALLSATNSRIVVQSHLRVLQSQNHEVLDPHALLFSLTLPGVREQVRDLVFVQSTLGTVAPRLAELVIPVIGKNDPAAASVLQFKATLEERDRLLALLSDQASTEVDL